MRMTHITIKTYNHSYILQITHTQKLYQTTHFNTSNQIPITFNEIFKKCTKALKPTSISSTLCRSVFGNPTQTLIFDRLYLYYRKFGQKGVRDDTYELPYPFRSIRI